jgi:peptide/nickel transport system substrate-binding protein
VVDQHTVDLITQTAYAPLLTKLVNVEIMSAETFKEIGADGYGAKPVGTGPYTLTEWVKGERVVLQANPSYWRGAPKTGRVVIVPIPETATRIAALESGSIDIAAELPAQFSQQARGGTKAIDAPGTRVFYVGLNVAQKPFSDLRVRQALNYGVNVAQLVKELLNGQAEVLKGPLFQRVFGFSDAVQGYQYDPQKAKALLSEAGYAGGFEATLDVAPTFKAMAEAIAGQLQPLGVKIKVNVLETAALYDKYEPGNSQMYLSSWGNSEADADATLATQLLSTRKVKYTNYANPEVDPLITAAASTVDPQERQKLYKSALEIVVRDAPWIFLYSPTETYGARDQVDGWKPRPDGRFNLLNVSVK